MCSQQAQCCDALPPAVLHTGTPWQDPLGFRIAEHHKFSAVQEFLMQHFAGQHSGPRGVPLCAHSTAALRGHCLTSVWPPCCHPQSEMGSKEPLCSEVRIFRPREG